MIIMKDLVFLLFLFFFFSFLVLIMAYCSLELLELKIFFGWVCGGDTTRGRERERSKFKNM